MPTRPFDRRRIRALVTSAAADDDSMGAVTPAGEGFDAARHAAGAQARELIIRLVDFLKDYDAQRNPPVTDVNAYGLYQLRGEDVVESPSITVTGGAETWMSVTFTELPPQPAIPDELAAFLPESSMISPTQRPVVTPPPPRDRERYVDPDDDRVAGERELEVLSAAEAWIAQAWAPWSASSRKIRYLQRMILPSDLHPLVKPGRHAQNEVSWGTLVPRYY